MSAGPNILLFLTDDHGAWATGCAGNREVRSPTLACLLTGRAPSQVGIHDWIQEQFPEFGDRGWLTDEVTLPELLRGAGYVCGLSGKWHLGRSHETPRGFEWCFGLPRWQGVHSGEYTYHRNGEPLTLTGNKTRLITDHALQFLDETSPDDSKLRSCATLFAQVAPAGSVSEAVSGSVFERLLSKYFQGQRDRTTLDLLDAAPDKE